MMAEFQIFPAIDLLEGEVVRLQQGDRRRKTVYSQDPVAIAERLVRAGARWLHVVNLDGAFGMEDSRNTKAIRSIIAAAGPLVQVQVGGGIRSLAGAAALLENGVARVILGTAAIEDHEFLSRAVEACGPGRIAIALDARAGVLHTRGWEVASQMKIPDLIDPLGALGVQTLIYTDIARDGMGVGVDRSGALKLKEAGFEVIASGGVASFADVVAVRQVGLAGVILGRALYEGHVDLAAAITAVAGEK